MKYIIALVGESGCGKNTIQDHLVQKYKDIKPILRMTNRPMREGEDQYNPYIFISFQSLQKMALAETEKFMEVEEIKDRGWFYATHTDLSFQKTSDKGLYIGCYSAESIEDLYEGCELMKDEFTLFVIKIHVDDKIRLNRQLMRENDPDCYEICRRFISDKKEYNRGLSMPHFEVDNSKDLNECLSAIAAIVEDEAQIKLDINTGDSQNLDKI